MYGSWATTRISKARARLTTSRPMLPSPTMPSVLPRSSWPISFFFSHLPARVEVLACGMERAMASISASVCSATDTAFPPGVFITSTPAVVAASRSTLSTPTPARPITLSLGDLASTSAVTWTALRTSSASASARCCAYSLGLETMTFQPGSPRNRSRAAGAMGSAMRMFIVQRKRQAPALCTPSLRLRRKRASGRSQETLHLDVHMGGPCLRITFIMPLIDQVQKDMVAAMKARQEARLSALRMVKAALMKQKVDSPKPLDEAAEMAVLKSLIKQRIDAADAFRKAGRAEQADKEEAERKLIETYLPE